MARVITYKIEGKDHITTIFDTADRKATKLKSNIGKLKMKLDGFPKPMKKIAFNFMKIERRALSFTNKIGDKMSGLKKKLGGFGTALVAFFATQKLGEFFVDLKTKASDLNESINKSKVVFGEYFSSIDKFSKRAEQSAGISKTQALANASAFGSMFKELGFGKKQIADLSEGAVQLASDLASFNNLDPGQAFEALFAGIKGETQVLATNFGIVLDDAMVKQKAYEMGLVSSTKGTLPKAIKVQATYAAILERTKDAQGDFARTSNDTANSERILKAQVENLQASMGKLLIPTYTKLVKKLREGVAWINQNKIQILKWTKVGIKIIGVLGGIWMAAKTILGVVSIINSVRKAYTLLKSATILAKIAQLAFNAVAMVNPFVWIGLAVVAVGAAVYMIIKHWDKIRKFLIKWGVKILTWLKNIGSFFLKLNPFYLLFKAIEKLFPGFKNKLIGFFQSIWDIIIKFGKILWKYSPFNMLLTAADWVFPGIKEKVHKIFSYIIDKIMSFVNWLKGSVLGQIVSKTFNLNWEDNTGAKEVKDSKIRKSSIDKIVLKKKNEKTPYDNVNLILNTKNKNKNIFSSPGTKSKNDLGGEVNKGLSSVVSGGGSIKNINVTIDKLIEKFEIKTTNIGASLTQVKSEVSRVLLSAVNDVNYAN